MEEIRLVVIKGEHAWVAQALEYDIAAQGVTWQEALQAWSKTLVCEVQYNLKHKRQPLEGIPRAPKRFVDLWEYFRPNV